MRGKMGKVLTLVSGMTLLAALALGCVRQPSPVSHGGPVVDYISLVDNLRAKGATVQPTGEVSRDFLLVEDRGRTISVNGENVQVFEYADAGVANAAASAISSDGTTVTRGNMIISTDYTAPPHWYKKERLIVLYVGENTGVINLLTELLGRQFTGR